jgi:hypothetical protein
VAESNAANGGMLVPEATQMETVSGRFVDTLNPDPATIDAGDIVQHLSKICRYGGAVKRSYSVAEHAVLVHDLVVHMRYSQRGDRLGALLHDGAEAYLQDQISPVKYALRMEEHHATAAGRAFHGFEGAYARLSNRMDVAIAGRFDFPPAAFERDWIKLADMWALRIEAHELTHSRGTNWRWPGELPEGGELPADVHWAGGLSPDAAAELLRCRLIALGIDVDFEEAGPGALTARSPSAAVSEQPPRGESSSPRDLPEAA